MILLKKFRLINWYAFSNVTSPVGFFTLIAGKNGNGKSVLLDAMKYAAYGDTVFNSASENRGDRTLSSYTRGLLDATAGTYMRPADQAPNVYSHIVLEFWDQVEEKPFLLGAVIETNASNNCQTYRYVMDRTSMDQVEHTYQEDGVIMPYSASDLQKKYRLTLMNREQGLPRFMQITGLKLNISQIPTYLRKLRGIMSYDPDARIDKFIRESVLEKRDVDFGKLISAKESIQRLNENFDAIQLEICELDQILGEYDSWESERNRLLSDDIRIVYKKMQDLQQEIRRQSEQHQEFEQEKEDLIVDLRLLEEKKSQVDQQLLQARISLNQLDSTRMIADEMGRLDALEKEKKRLAESCKKLEHFQTVIDQMITQFFAQTGELEDRRILMSLCGQEDSAAEKASAVGRFRQKTDQLYEDLVKETAGAELELRELNRRLDEQHRILDECRKHRNTYAQIPDYVGLRQEINREFDRRKIKARAQFACEYVIGLKDEAWRDAVEAFLGPRRYTILVDSEYYDVADDVLNHSEYRYAHLFNTKLLMKKTVQVEADSAVQLLDIRNSVAKKYFDYQLGRMHAVELTQVRNFENAISREGRVSVAMDSYFLRFDRIRSYYLGQQTFELNRIRAEREIERLSAEKKMILGHKKELEEKKSILAQDREFFLEYDYDAPRRYQQAAEGVRSSKEQLQRLKKSQENNQEFIELNQQVTRLENEQKAAQQLYMVKLQERAKKETAIQRCKEKIENRTQDLEGQKQQYQHYQTTYYMVTKRAVDAYEKHLENGQKGPGGLLAEETRGRIRRSIEQHKSNLIQKQADYHAKHSDNLLLPLGTDGREQYAARKERIWMDNLQEIRQKLAEQTRRYEEIFKNEFVLTILKSCERAREDLKQINRELEKLNFSAKYQFDVHYLRDGSPYSKIIEYAKFLDEREQRGGIADGQITLQTMTAAPDAGGRQLEKEMKEIINRIIEKNSEETIARFADYRNYMTYEILITNQVLDRAKLSRQTGFNSGAEVQIPYLLILSSALLLIYNQRVNSTRLVFIDEPFAKMDPGNVKLMLDFMKKQRLQVIFCAPDKTESIGNECEVILPVLRVRPDSMQLGIVQFHEEKAYDGL